jgi:hypothetical protein
MATLVLRDEASLNIAEGSAAGAKEENAIEGVTDTAAHRSEPLALGLARARPLATAEAPQAPL